MDDEAYMRLALALARTASLRGEVPVGAVIVEPGSGRMVACGANRREAERDPTAHAEMLAIRAAAQVRGSWRLSDLTLYVTLEPCAMCAGAIVLARLHRVVYGASDPKAGAMGSCYRIGMDGRLNHAPVVRTGVLGEVAAQLLQGFFQQRRGKRGEVSEPG